MTELLQEELAGDSAIEVREAGSRRAWLPPNPEPLALLGPIGLRL